MSATSPENTAARAQLTLSGYVRAWWEKVRSGDLGSLPIVVGILAILIVFGIVDSRFFSPQNFTNLLLQMAPVATIAIGIVFVLLIGEIDLSAAFVSAVGAVIMTLLLRPGDPGWSWWMAIGVALLITTFIGFLHAIVITKAGVPSFVVTLAGLLTWSGVVLVLTTQFSTAGTIRIQDPTVVGLANQLMTPALGWAVAIVVIAGFAVTEYVSSRTRRAGGLEAKPVAVIVLRVVGVAVVTLFAVWYANTPIPGRDVVRGLPLVTVILLVFLSVWSFVASRTRFGRHVYAVGGNAEAARRAGINVDGVRIAVFMISSFMAGLGGIILASRLRSVATNTGGGNLLLNAIAAAVIGGTSLFGGKGRVVAALLGAIVIASIENGMNLLGLASGTKFVITGLVLLAAVLVDALSKRRRSARGVV